MALILDSVTGNKVCTSIQDAIGQDRVRAGIGSLRLFGTAGSGTPVEIEPLADPLAWTNVGSKRPANSEVTAVRHLDVFFKCDASTNRCKISAAQWRTIECDESNPLQLNHAVQHSDSKQYCQPA